MIFGTQYYRPPFPGCGAWRRDLEHIKALGFNTIKIWAVWNWIERQPGRFDFSELDELVALCKEFGLSVVINTIPEGAPYWTAEDEDHFFQTAKGEVLRYSGPANIPSAGWPGYCPDSELGQGRICAFIEKTAEHFKDNTTVTAIDVWNEPHLEPMFDYSGQLLCYCEHSKVKFVRWLKARYESLDTLNGAWFRTYQSWDQVEPPRRFGTVADMIDWRRFWLYNLQDWLRARVAAARKGAPGKVIQTHTAFSGYMGANNFGGLGNELGDEFLLAREVNAFGLSSFPLWLMGDEHVEGHLINAEIIAEASGDVPFYQVELQGGAGKAGLLGGKVPSAEDIRDWNWSVIAAGGKGVLYWQYAAEPAGTESPGFGLVNFDGSDTPRSLSAGACAKRFDVKWLDSARRVSPVNAIYISRNSDLFCYAMGDEEKYNRSFRGVYRALYDAGVPVRFVHGDTAADLYAQGVRNVYVPMGLCLDGAEREALKAFARDGGRLIAEGGFGLYRENGQLDMDASLLNELFGMTGVAVEPVSQALAELENGGAFVCDAYRQTYHSCGEGCRVLARFDDGCAAALRAGFGRGEVIWIAGFASLAYSLNPDAQSGAFFTSLFDALGYAQVERLDTHGMAMRLLENGREMIAVCANHGGHKKTLELKLSGMESVRADIPPHDGAILCFPAG